MFQQKEISMTHSKLGKSSSKPKTDLSSFLTPKIKRDCNSPVQSSLKRSEYTQSSPNRRGSRLGKQMMEHRLSFTPQSPTRYQDQSIQRESNDSFVESPCQAHSEDIQMSTSIDQTQAKSMVHPNSDFKNIKITKLLDLHKQRSCDIYASSLANTDVMKGQIEPIKDIQAIAPGVREFSLNQIEGDRFIPTRSVFENEEIEINHDTKIEIETGAPPNLFEDSSMETGNTNNQNNSQNQQTSSNEVNSGENLRKYNILLQSQLLNIRDPHQIESGFLHKNSFSNCKTNGKAVVQGQSNLDQERYSLLQMMSNDPLCDFSLPLQEEEQIGQKEQGFNILNYANNNAQENQKPLTYSQMPFAGLDEDEILSTPYTQQRKIPKTPFKVLDAPALQDDYYLNLVDWSAGNTLAVGLGSCVYLWSASTSKVTKLYDLGPQDQITSVNWSLDGQHLAVGTSQGILQNWDVQKQKIVKRFAGHEGRIGCIAWNGQFLSSGSRDKTILHRDPRERHDFFARLEGHKQEVCGLEWSPDGQQLASGGNDNKLMIWGRTNHQKAIVKFSEHVAAVKAIAWNPHQHGVLCSGGGTADRCIRFWNSLTCKPLHWVDTGSQVCNLAYSKNVNELVSTHGYSKNEIIVWKQPQMKKLAVLTGHTYRVLYLALSPDGQTLVTGAGDEALRFWKVFPPKRKAVTRPSIIEPSLSNLR